jgi:hypothetical protein
VFREIIANVEQSKPRNGTRSKRSKKGKKWSNIESAIERNEALNKRL